jgi:hypothetical protein
MVYSSSKDIARIFLRSLLSNYKKFDGVQIVSNGELFNENFIGIGAKK